jgi:hypothetical protein
MELSRTIMMILIIENVTKKNVFRTSTTKPNSLSYLTSPVHEKKA